MPLIKLIHIDCMEYMKDVPDKFFDLAIVDPPYFKGIGKQGYFGKVNSSIGVKRGEYNIPMWDEMIPDEKYLDSLVRISKHQIIWGINYFRFYHTAGRIVWDKVNGNSSFSDCEIASCSLHDSVRLFRYMWNGMQQARSVSEPDIMQGNVKLNEKRIHPTQKPIPLYKWLLRNYAASGDKIFDSHLGSGSIAIACHDMKFDLVGCEIDKDYYDSAVKRFENHKRQLTLF